MNMARSKKYILLLSILLAIPKTSYADNKAENDAFGVGFVFGITTFLVVSSCIYISLAKSDEAQEKATYTENFSKSMAQFEKLINKYGNGTVKDSRDINFMLTKATGMPVKRLILEPFNDGYFKFCQHVPTNGPKKYLGLKYFFINLYRAKKTVEVFDKKYANRSVQLDELKKMIHEDQVILTRMLDYKDTKSAIPLQEHDKQAFHETLKKLNELREEVQQLMSDNATHTISNNLVIKIAQPCF